MGSTILTIIVTLLIFSLLVISHEFGHFIVAVRCGITVEEFSMGMGPLLWKKQTKTTQYSLRLFPIGGYCQMKDYDPEDPESTPEGAFNSASPLRRILTIAAGATMNFIVALIIIFIIICAVGNEASTTLGSIVPDSPAQAAGLSVGDTILSVDGQSVEKWEDFGNFVNAQNGEAVSVTIKKTDGSIETLDITPTYSEEAQKYTVGVTCRIQTNVPLAVLDSFKMLGTYFRLITETFIGLFRGEVGMEVLSGPIGAGVLIGRSISQGLLYVLNIMASISMSLGYFNLLPIPMLDGSRIIFILIELIKGSPVNPKKEGLVHTIGFIALMFVAVLIAYKDIITLF